LKEILTILDEKLSRQLIFDKLVMPRP